MDDEWIMDEEALMREAESRAVLPSLERKIERCLMIFS